MPGMIQLRRFFLFSLLGIVCSQAHAVDMPYFVGIQVGASTTHFPGYQGNGFYAVSGIVGYHFTQNVGLQLGYTSYRGAFSGKSRLNQGSFDFLGVLSFPIWDPFSVSAKLGAAERVASLHSANQPTVQGDAFTFLYGLGLNYDLISSLVVSFNWQQALGKKGALENRQDLPSINFYSLGLTYRF